MKTLLLIVSMVAYGDTILPGLTVNELAPVQPGGTTTSNVTSFNTITDRQWMSNGQKLFRLGVGDYDQTINLRKVDGGPINNESVTTDLVFDAAGRMYVADFNLGRIFVSVDGVIWETFADVALPRTMEFHGDNLIVIGGNSDPTQMGFVSSISPLGVVTQVGETQGETFVFDGDSIVIPKYDGTGIDRMDLLDGTLTSLFIFDSEITLFESIAMTAMHYIVGVNTSSIQGNSSRLELVHKLTGRRTVLGINVGDSIPVDLLYRDNKAIISGFGSTHLNAIEGDIDAAAAVPEPNTIVMMLLGLAALISYRQLS